MRLGFLFNHDAGHQVAHGLAIALAVDRSYPDVDLRIFVSAGASHDEVRRIWGEAGNSPTDRRIQVLAGPSQGARAVTAISGRALPLDRVSVLRRNVHRFRDLDALVVPEKTSTLLKTRFGLRELGLVHTRHGAGDRAIGFDEASRRFDLILISGQKIKDRLEGAGALEGNEYAIVGYPKFDLFPPPARSGGIPLFDNGRPTVLYNPHPSPALSSWYRMGSMVLDWFAAQDKLNLIFAPHVMLFSKRWTIGLRPLSIARVAPLPRRYLDLPHIRIDTGSSACTDMTYTRAADIYLGDASSQVYEFLRDPRPAVFLNPRDLRWKGDPNFSHWQAGEVVSSIDGMAAALDRALERPSEYADVQRRLFAYSFDLSERRSDERAADAIVSWLKRRIAGRR